MVVDGDGAAWVAWSYDYHPQLFDKPVDADQPTVFISKIVGGRAASPLLVGTVGEQSHAVDLFPTLAVDEAGALWCAYDAYAWGRSGRTIRLAHREGRGFKHAPDLRTGQSLCSTPELTTGHDGALLAAWSECAFATWQGIVGVVRDGRIVAETPLVERRADVLYPQAAQGADGRVWVVYEKCDAESSEVVLKEIGSALAVP